MSIFKNVPIDPDTRIINQHGVEVEGIPALIQQWSWEGFIAESIIFLNADVAHLDESELFDLVRRSCLVNDDRFTVSRSESGFTFVNYNFVEYEDLIAHG